MSTRCSTTALDAKISIHCRCGRSVHVRLGELRTCTRFRCACNAVVRRDLRDYAASIDEIERDLAEYRRRNARRAGNVCKERSQKLQSTGTPGVRAPRQSPADRRRAAQVPS